MLEKETAYKHNYLKFLNNEIHSTQKTKHTGIKEGYKIMVLSQSIMEKYIPVSFNLEQNHPNPFNGKTTIKYYVPYKSKVIIMVFNCDGFILEKVVTQEHNAGIYKLEICLDGLPEGVYFYQLIADRYTETRSMELIKMN